MMPDALTSNTARGCRDCSACCSHLAIPAGEVGPGRKPAGMVCPRHGPNGCRIYGQRPKLCRDFQCTWLSDASWPAEWRPHRLGLLCIREEIDVNLPAAAVFEIRPGALQKSTAVEILEELQRTTAVIAIVDSQEQRRHLLGKWSVETAEPGVRTPHFLEGPQQEIENSRCGAKTIS